MIAQYDFATPTYAEAIALRDLVLRKPLGRTIADDDLQPEHEQYHFGAFHQGALVGTATLQQSGPGKLKMRQVAVLPQWQGRAVGRALVQACEAFAKTRHANRLYCHARCEAQQFYLACQWTIEGEVFTEVGIPHVLMVAPNLA